MRRLALETMFDPGLFRALAEPTRIRLLEILMREGGEANVSTIAQHVEIDLSVVSRHLRELVRAGVLDVERVGRERWYRLRHDALIAHFRELVRQLEALRDGRACC